MLVLFFEEILIVKLCELEEVFVFLSVSNILFCKYDVIKNELICICNWGIFFLVLILLIFFLILNFIWIFKYNGISIFIRVSI